MKRIQKELEMIEKHGQILCVPIDDSYKQFHFTFKGEKDSVFEDGIYHGEINLPDNYPLGPPTIIFLSENGRFHTLTKICLNASNYHALSWQSSWTSNLKSAHFAEKPSVIHDDL